MGEVDEKKTGQEAKMVKAMAFGQPRDKKTNALIHPPTHFLASFALSGLLGGLGVGGETMQIFAVTPSPPTTTSLDTSSSSSSSRAILAVVGGISLAASIGLAFLAMSTFRKHKTPVPHGYKVRKIVSDGPFSVSRNPIYVGMVGAVGSLSLLTNTWWGMLGELYLFSVINSLVIPSEEKYLEETFGHEYKGYQKTTPRWLLFI